MKSLQQLCEPSAGVFDEDFIVGSVKALLDQRVRWLEGRPAQDVSRIHAAYPFHQTIRDLYARFRENPGFQQTRGLIRLMRIVVSRLWQSGAGDRRYLINAYEEGD